MNWYHAADGQQAGPFTEEQFRELIASGVVQPATLVWEARLPNWVPLSQVPPEVLAPAATAAAFPGMPPAAGTAGVICAECGRSFAPDEVIRLADRNVCASCKPVLVQRLSEGAAPASVAGIIVSEEEVLQRDYRVDIGRCLERAWKVTRENLGPVLISGLLFLGLLLGMIAIIGAGAGIIFGALGALRGGGTPPIFAMLGIGLVLLVIIIAAGLAFSVCLAGYSWFYLNLFRHGHANIGQIFEGFRRQLASLLGTVLIQGLISGALTAPFSFLAQIIPAAGLSPLATITAVLLLQFISTALSLYLWAIWLFSTLLILDKGMRAWPSLQLSRRLVSKSIWMTLLLLIVAIIIAFAGGFACLVGLFLSVPFAVLMKAALYDDNFRDLQPTPT